LRSLGSTRDWPFGQRAGKARFTGKLLMAELVSTFAMASFPGCSRQRPSQRLHLRQFDVAIANLASATIQLMGDWSIRRAAARWRWV